MGMEGGCDPDPPPSFGKAIKRGVPSKSGEGRTCPKNPFLTRDKWGLNVEWGGLGGSQGKTEETGNDRPGRSGEVRTSSFRRRTGSGYVPSERRKTDTVFFS